MQTARMSSDSSDPGITIFDRDSSQEALELVGSISTNTNPSQGGRRHMPDESKSLGQTYYEEVEALKAEGMSNADAVRAVAEKHGKKENAVRGGIHQYRKAHLATNGATPTRRRGRSSAPSVDELVASARRSLEEALSLIDREVEQKKAALDAAQADYDEAVASVKDKKADIEKKLQALA